MSRGPFFTLLAVGLVSVSVARAQVDVAPAPRPIHPDGTRDPAPQPEQAKKVNPLEVVERIIKNSKAVGDKLAMTDTGTETRAKQDTILKDIQSLIEQQEDPPPQSNSDMNKSDQDKEKSPSDKKSDMMPMGGMDMLPMKGDMPMGGKGGKGGMGGQGGMNEQPMGDNDDQPKGRRPRQQGGQPKDKDDQPKDPGMNTGGNMQQPMNPMPPRDSKNASGGRPDPTGDPKDPGRPSLPPAVDIAKEVWGHLPDKLRQQATQYYQQEFMPRYAELLKQYYASLSDKGMKK